MAVLAIVFASTSTSATAVMQDADEDAFEADENSIESGNCNAALSKAKAEVNRATGNLYDFLIDIMSCKYLEDLRETAKGTETIPKLLQQHMAAQSNSAESKEQSTVVSCDFVKKFAVVVKAFEHNSKSFAADSAVPAPSILATLNKGRTSDDLKGARESLEACASGGEAQIRRLQCHESNDHRGLQDTLHWFRQGVQSPRQLECQPSFGLCFSRLDRGRRQRTLASFQ